MLKCFKYKILNIEIWNDGENVKLKPVVGGSLYECIIENIV